MQQDKVQEYRRHVDALRLQEVGGGWVHHLADLTLPNGVRTEELDRPIALKTRLDWLTQLVGERPGLSGFTLYERRLTARAPFEQSPLSYLNSFGPSWSLLAEDNRLEWADFGQDHRAGVINFWFRNVAVGTAALVTIDITAGALGPGVTGNIEVRSSDASPRLFPVSGFADHTFDLVVHPSEPYAVLVTMEAMDGVGYLAFRQITYRTL